MKSNKDSEKRIKNQLKAINKEAYRFMKYGLTWKARYSLLQKTEIWQEGKKLLLEYAQLKSSPIFCSFCNQPLDPHRTILHHRIYNKRKLFSPRHTQFVHYQCHHQYHLTERVSRTRIFFRYRGIRIYHRVLGSIFIPYSCIIALIITIIILIYFL